MAFHSADPVSSLLALATALAIAASGQSAAQAPGQGSAANRRIVVLGDSLAVSPAPAQSFPAWLQKKLDEQSPGWTIVNAGIRGDTTAGGRRRVAALLGSDVALLVVALGANDGLRGVPVATVEDNLSAIIEAAQQHGVPVLLCGMETPPMRGWEYTLGFHELYPRLARRHDVPLVPFLLTGVALVRGMNLPDGVHPNAAGARLIADNVWPYLESALRQISARGV
jgi:acyl-CoA thioesterase-1